MRNKYCMKTYTAMVSAKAGAITRLIKTEIRAASAAEAKWLLQAIYGFHSVASVPAENRELLTSEDSVTTPTPEQQRLNALKASKDAAAKALKVERDRQKRQSALKTLQAIS